MTKKISVLCELGLLLALMGSFFYFSVMAAS